MKNCYFEPQILMCSQELHTLSFVTDKQLGRVLQGTVRAVLPRGLVHDAPPQGGLHRLPGHHRCHGRRVAHHQLAAPSVDEGPTTPEQRQELRSLRLQLPGK